MLQYTYAVRVIEKVESAPGKWYGAKIGVYRIAGDNEEQVGVYSRNYRSLLKLPDGITLEQAIDMADYNDDPSEEWSNHITIAIQRKFDLRDGKVVD